MFLPQRTIAAPGATLLEQLIYPTALRDSPANLNLQHASLRDSPAGLDLQHAPLSDCPASLDLQHAAHLLHGVGLADLLHRVNGDWLRQEDWQGERPLSKWLSRLGSATCNLPAA